MSAGPIVSVRSIVNDTTGSLGRKFSFFIQFLIIVSLISFSFSTLPNLTARTKTILYYVEVFSIVIFTLEYLLRIISSENRLKFVFSFYGIIDLLAILPFYFSAGLDLRAIRAFRLLRLIRIFKLIRYSSAIDRFHRALIIVKEEMILFGFASVVLLYLSAVGIYYFESQAQPEQFKSVFHCLWWSVTTLTTVGYGDMYPVTAGGRLFTFFVLIIGLGIVAVPAGLVASALSKARESE